MKRRLVPLGLCALGMLLLILDSREAAQSGRETIQLCIRTVIPSLFPFFLLSACLTGAGGNSIPVAGFLGGYPVGAQALAQQVRTGRLDKDQANRMLTWCSQAGPSFIFGIAAAQFPGTRYGWYLWAIQIISALSVRQFFPSEERKTQRLEAGNMDFSQAMGTALRAMGSVCGWVIIFRVILGFLDRWFFFMLPNYGKILLAGLLELTNGCLMLPGMEDPALRFLMCLLFLNFGGFCVVLQTVSVAGSLDIRYYLAGKLLQTLFSLLYGCVILGHFSVLIPLVLLYAPILFRKTRKNSSIPAAIGV